MCSFCRSWFVAGFAPQTFPMNDEPTEKLTHRQEVNSGKCYAIWFWFESAQNSSQSDELFVAPFHVSPFSCRHKWQSRLSGGFFCTELIYDPLNENWLSEVHRPQVTPCISSHITYHSVYFISHTSHPIVKKNLHITCQPDIFAVCPEKAISWSHVTVWSQSSPFFASRSKHISRKSEGFKIPNNRYGLCERWINPRFYCVNSCSLICRSEWLSKVASSSSGRPQWIYLAVGHWKFQWPQKLGCLGPPRQLIAIPLSDYQKVKVTGRYVGVIGRMRHSDGARCLESFSRMLWIVSGCVVQMRSPTFQYLSPCSWPKTCLQIRNSNIGKNVDL
jgi:hypothetical protein